MIRHANNQLMYNLVSTPDPYEKYIKENSDVNRKTDSEETVNRITVKIERIDDSQLVDEDREIIDEQNAECGKVEITLDPLEYESTTFASTVCHEEFPHQHGYGAQLGMQLQGGALLDAPSTHNVGE